MASLGEKVVAAKQKSVTTDDGKAMVTTEDGRPVKEAVQVGGQFMFGDSNTTMAV